MRVNEDIRASQEESSLHPASASLLGLWEGLRAGRSAPKRNDLDLGQMRHLMPCMFVAERPRGSAAFTWRLAGTAVCALYGRELTGSGLLDDWDAFERGVIQRFLAAVVQHHRPAALRFRFRTDQDQHVSAEMAALPMIAADGVSTHVLGGLFPFRNPQLKPYSSIIQSELVGARFLHGQQAGAPPEEVETQARRKFRVISGGLDRP